MSVLLRKCRSGESLSKFKTTCTLEGINSLIWSLVQLRFPSLRFLASGIITFWIVRCLSLKDTYEFSSASSLNSLNVTYLPWLRTIKPTTLLLGLNYWDKPRPFDSAMKILVGRSSLVKLANLIQLEPQAPPALCKELPWAFCLTRLL